MKQELTHWALVEYELSQEKYTSGKIADIFLADIPMSNLGSAALKYCLLSIIVTTLSLTSYNQELFEVDGAITIQDSKDPTPVAGTIRWSGTDFEGWNGQRWVSLTGYAVTGSVTDIDGNTYQTSRIGDQEWMIENLSVSRYRNGEEIHHITDDVVWTLSSVGAWCHYENVESNDEPLGKLYNWFAVKTHRLCPTGWHVPDKGEWRELLDYLGGEEIAAGKMKEPGTEHWVPPNRGASNESGFTALGSGHRTDLGIFEARGLSTHWWSASEISLDRGSACYLEEKARIIATNKKRGHSVRCIRNRS